MRVPFFIGACTALFAVPAGASAQTLMVNISQIDGPGGTRTIQEDVLRGVNLADCANPGGTTLTFSLNAVGATELQIWRGGASSTCEIGTSRSGDMIECDELDAVTPADDNTFTLTLAQLLAGTAPSAGLCDEGGDRQGDEMRIFVFNRDGALGTTEDVPPSDFARLQVNVDASPPAAPTVSSTAVSGDTSVGLSWTGLGGEENIEYQVFADAGALGCESSRLTPGLEPPEDATVVRTTGVMVTNTTVDPSGLGLQEGESTLVFVAGRDNARNVGVLSEGICVTRVATFGYCDSLAQMADAGMDVETCPDGCAAGPSAPAGLAFALVALVHHRRRRGTS